jgi:deoxyribonuclease V
MYSLAVCHPWPITTREAIAIQQRLRSEVITKDDLGAVRYVAGVDVGFEAKGTIAHAALAVLRFPELELHQHVTARRPVHFPYKPGLLAFREAPAVLEALTRLITRPDLLLCDGHGYAHPRRCGLACHLGVLSDIPTIGVAKTRFIGQHDPVPNQRGAWQPIYERGEIIGAALRTRVNVKPIYVSVGHRVSLTTAIDYVLRCTATYRLPETTRWAHHLASATDQKPDP